MAGFKEMLKYLRSREHMSQAELAQKLGVSKSTISMYEVGKREPDFETLESIADLFNVDMNFLLDHDGSEMTPFEHSASYYTNPETARLAQKYFDDPNYRVLFDAAEDSRPEDIQMAAELLRRLKEGSY